MFNEPQSRNSFLAGMGTKLECAINPLASSNFSVHLLDDYCRTSVLKENCQKIVLHRIGSSMDSNKNMDSIRKTMQMHEDIFKHQVRELHRLYSVQRTLMDEVKRESKRNRVFATSDINININQNRLTTQAGHGYNIHVQGDPSERSGSCSTDTVKVAKGFDLEIRLQAEEDISAEASIVEEDQAQARPTKRNQMSIQGSDEETEIELTLSIGGSSSKKASNKAKVDSSGWFKSDPNTPTSSSSATIDQERKRSHWLFQGLSINRTS